MLESKCSYINFNKEILWQFKDLLINQTKGTAMNLSVQSFKCKFWISNL